MVPFPVTMDGRFKQWCSQNGGEIHNGEKYITCEHPVGKGEYKDKVAYSKDGNSVSIPGQWSGWVSGIIDITFDDEMMVIGSQYDRSLIQFEDDSFEFYWHENDDPAPEIREMHDSAFF